MRFIFNGFFHIGGQERMAKEIFAELDKVVLKNEIAIVVPKGFDFGKTFKNIEIIHYGSKNKFFWMQFSYPHFLKKNQLIGINLFNFCPICRPDITAILDLTPVFYKTNYTLRTRFVNFYWSICRKSATKKGLSILTISENSKKDICDLYKIPQDKVIVFGCGWDHIKRIKANEEALSKYNIKAGDYYFALSSIAPHKNFDWIIEMAKKQKNSLFCVAGAETKIVSNGLTKEKPNNLRYLGHISDEDMITIMKNCKAFLFPSFYEGFGIPPLEALALKVPVVVSNCSCLPEIYGASVHYINPYDTDVDLEKLLAEEVDSPKEVLQKYTWEKMAYIILTKVIRV